MLLALLLLASSCSLQVNTQGVFSPDRRCTPGDTLAVSVKALCTKGYTQTVRNVPAKTHKQVFTNYGISSHRVGQYEVDHLISLELGGSNDIRNLWPEPSLPRPGFHQKDVCENLAHKQVCDGTISLEEAQDGISTDWLGFCTKIGAVK